MDETIDFSVVLPVHIGVAPAHLDRALQSVFAQTLPPREVVVVEDGPLSPEQDRVLSRLQGGPIQMRRIRLEMNSGAGVANQIGLAAARYGWVAKMDADDVCTPTRLERQAAALRSGDIDVLGSAMAEFDEDENAPSAVRSVPQSHGEIARRMRINNPMNHPTAVYRRDMAMAVGGYSDLRFMQDYDLFARMLANGARMANLGEPLVLFRADDAMFRRRSSAEVKRCEWRLQNGLVEYGLISRPRMYVNLALRLGFRSLPGPVLRAAYRLLFLASPGRSGA